MGLTKISTGGVKDDTADEAKLKISNAGTNGQFLQKSSGTGGLTWADAASEGTDIKSTGESGTTKFLRTDGDGTSSWQPIPTDNTRAAVSGQEFTGVVGLKGTTQLKFYDAGDISNYIHVKAPSLTADTTYILPTADGSSGQYLQTDGSGNLSFSTITVPPAGNSVDLVADGAIAAGKPVIIKSNGKAEQVKESYAAQNTPTWNTTSESVNIPNAWCPIARYSASADTYVFMFRDGDYTNLVPGQLNSSNQWIGGLGSVTGNISSDNDYSQHASMAIVPASEVSGTSNDVLVVIYRDYPGNNNGYVRLGTVNSNNTVSFNSGHTGATGEDLFRSSMEAVGNGKILLAYSDGSNVRARIINVTASNAFSLGSEVTVGSSSSSNGVFVSQADSNGKVIITYANSSNNLKARAASISGTTITLGTEVELDNYALSSLRDCKVAYNKDDNNFLAVWTDNSLQCAAMTVSGTTITKSAATQVANIETRGIGVVYDSRLKHFWAHVSRDGNNNDQTNYYYPITETAATTPSIGTAKTTTFSLSSGNNIDGLNSLYIEADNIIVSVGRYTATNDLFVTNARVSTTTSNLSASAQNFLGFAEDAISDGNSGTIKLPGNIVGNQSGLTPGSHYYVKNDGTIASGGVASSAGGLAVASDKMMIRAVPKS